MTDTIEITFETGKVTDITVRLWVGCLINSILL